MHCSEATVWASVVMFFVYVFFEFSFVVRKVWAMLALVIVFAVDVVYEALFVGCYVVAVWALKLVVAMGIEFLFFVGRLMRKVVVVCLTFIAGLLLVGVRVLHGVGSGHGGYEC